MSLFGRSKHKLEAIAVEFLPFNGELHILVADADMNLQILQFDPESTLPPYEPPPTSQSTNHKLYPTDPKSEGSRLLHKSTFHTGHFPATMHLLQSHLKMPDAASTFGPTDDSFTIDTASGTATSSPLPLHQVLITSQSGTLALLTPLSESSYRRLSNLSAYLVNTLESAGGLNPIAYRAGEGFEGGWDAGSGARGVLDGGLLMRWGELGEQKRREGLAKYGGDEWGFGGEREVLAGWGIFGARGA